MGSSLAKTYLEWRTEVKKIHSSKYDNDQDHLCNTLPSEPPKHWAYIVHPYESDEEIRTFERPLEMQQQATSSQCSAQTVPGARPDHHHRSRRIAAGSTFSSAQSRPLQPSTAPLLMMWRDQVQSQVPCSMYQYSVEQVSALVSEMNVIRRLLNMDPVTVQQIMPPPPAQPQEEQEGDDDNEMQSF